jgi:putative addiction module component (TIGR02574 family)
MCYFPYILSSERVRRALFEASAFSPEERAELADELWRSLPGDEASEANAEIARRIEDVLAGRAELVSTEEAHAELRATARR